jgi:hypothetical protein
MAAPEPRVRDALTRLFDGGASPALDLAQAVSDHLHRVRAAASTNPFVDLATAERVAAAWLEQLVGYDSLADEQRVWISAGCRYFAECQDGEADLESIVGFDDDLEVLDHVLARIGRR